MLAPLAELFQPGSYPDLLVGLGPSDDAAVYRIDDERAIVATLDFFPPIVDDPETYGAIAAANAMSDVFAMGGEVVLALNIAAFPESLPIEAQTAILRGAALKVAEAGGVVAGGHTVWDDEPKFGLSVLGLAHPGRLLTKGALRPGDRVYLTKPIGTGVLTSAARQDRARPSDLATAATSMLRLNRHASHLALAAGLRAVTDVTGFGLLGHLWEMAERSQVSIIIDATSVPHLPGALDASAGGVETGGAGRNRQWLDAHVTVTAASGPAIDLFYDPQTSGGLLIGVPEDAVWGLEAAFRRDAEPLWLIGAVAAGPSAITVR